MVDLKSLLDAVAGTASVPALLAKVMQAVERQAAALDGPQKKQMVLNLVQAILDRRPAILPEAAEPQVRALLEGGLLGDMIDALVAASRGAYKLQQALGCRCFPV